MRTGLPLVRLQDIMRPRLPDVEVVPTERYQFAGVYSFARGMFRGQERAGSEFSYRVLSKLTIGDFVYPKLMAWEGAFGVVTPECGGCYVSPEFPVFHIDHQKMLPRWIELYFKIPTVWQAISGGSIGTNVRRRRLYPGELLNKYIPLPPLDEQHRIVARIERLAAKVAEGRGLREGAAAEIKHFLAAAEMQIWPNDTIANGVPLASLTTHLTRGRQSEQGESDHFLIKTQHVQQGAYIPTFLTLAPHASAKVRPEARARHGDILIACSAAGCLGRVARFSDPGKTASTDTHVAIARPNADRVDPDYLYAYLRGAQGQIQLRSRERGDWQREKIGFRLTELNLADLKRVPVPLPRSSRQKEIVADLDGLRADVDVVKRLQAETAAELDAMLPAILDKAFKGEL